MRALAGAGRSDPHELHPGAGVSWLAFSFAAAACWGLTYVLNEILYRSVSFASTMAIGNIVVGLIMVPAAWRMGVLATDARAMLASPSTLGVFVAGTVSLIAAECFIALSITAKNAALAGLVEISYPLFIVAFSAPLLGRTGLNLGTLIGGLLVLAGVALVSLNAE
jgi:drug/metabolite transporter (DMT)-like permease